MGVVDIPAKLEPVFQGPARYRGAYGGRGSGKTRTFALMSAIWGMNLGSKGREGQILCGREFQNSLAESSLEEVKAAIRSHDWLADYYDLGDTYVRSKDGRIRYTFAGLHRNVDSIKSMARILLAWVDEAEPVTETSWQKLIPTVREAGSEIWVTWNPESKRSATHLRFRESPPDRAKIVSINYDQNPWFPEVLDAERRDDMEKRPHVYDHVWLGNFLEISEGAYFAASLRQARDEGRIGFFGRDPLHEVRAFWDVGGTGRLADATAIWVAQFIGREVRVLDYYEATGQEFGEHVYWLRERGYKSATCVLPHDGASHDKVFNVSPQSALQKAGFPTVVVPNQGAGAARKRIDAARLMFPSVRFNEKTTDAGREALAAYHEKIDEERGIGLGPLHNWASHGADAFGLMAVAHQQHSPAGKSRPSPKRRSAWTS